MLNRSIYESSTKAQFDLHWLPVRFRIKHKILCIVYKALHNQAPKYLSDLLHYKTTDYNTRAEDRLDLVVPKIAKTGNNEDRAFEVCGPKLWNRTPTDIRASESFEVFKGKIKTFFFREAYPELTNGS